MNVKLLGMERGIGFDKDRLADHLLHLLQPLGAWRLELFDDLWVDPQHDISAIQMLVHLPHLDVDVVSVRHG